MEDPRDRGAMGQTAAPSWTTGPHNGWTSHRGPGQAQWVDNGGYPDYVKDGPFEVQSQDGDTARVVVEFGEPDDAGNLAQVWEMLRDDGE
jgi:hypothetical protein